MALKISGCLDLQAQRAIHLNSAVLVKGRQAVLYKQLCACWQPADTRSPAAQALLHDKPELIGLLLPQLGKVGLASGDQQPLHLTKLGSLASLLCPICACVRGRGKGGGGGCTAAAAAYCSLEEVARQ